MPRGNSSFQSKYGGKVYPGLKEFYEMYKTLLPPELLGDPHNPYAGPPFSQNQSNIAPQVLPVTGDGSDYQGYDLEIVNVKKEQQKEKEQVAKEQAKEEMKEKKKVKKEDGELPPPPSTNPTSGTPPPGGFGTGYYGGGSGGYGGRNYGYYGGSGTY